LKEGNFLLPQARNWYNSSHSWCAHSFSRGPCSLLHPRSARRFTFFPPPYRLTFHLPISGWSVPSVRLGHQSSVCILAPAGRIFSPPGKPKFSCIHNTEITDFFFTRRFNTGVSEAPPFLFSPISSSSAFYRFFFSSKLHP